MKKNKIVKSTISIFMLSSFFLAMGLPVSANEAIEYQTKASISFIASEEPVDPVNPEDPDVEVEPENPGTGTTGPLSIDFVSSFKFGEQKITSKDMTYYAAPQKVTVKETNEVIEVPNYAQVSDYRGTEGGWTLFVSQESPFKSTSNENHTLSGATIEINNIQAVTHTDSEELRVESDIVLEGNDTKVLVMSAAVGRGAGIHLAKFGDISNMAKSVSLYIPGKITKYAEAYETTLRWTLAETPDDNFMQ